MVVTKMRVTSSEVMGNLREGDNTMEGARRVRGDTINFTLFRA